MKQLTILLAILFSYIAAQAQTASVVNRPHGTQAQEHYKKLMSLARSSVQQQAKPTLTQQRLTSHSRHIDTGQGLFLTDSIDYYYDFGRGSRFDFFYMQYNDYYYYPNFDQVFVRYDSAYIVNGDRKNDYSVTRYYASSRPAEQIFFNNPDLSRNAWQYDNAGKVTKATRDIWQPSLSSWVTDYHTFFEYDAQENVASDSSEISAGLNFTPVEKNDYIYDALGLPIGITSYIYNGGTWSPDFRSTATFNAQGMPQMILFEEHDGTGWVNSEKLVTTYKNDGYKLTEVDSFWNIPGNNWYLVSEEHRRLNTQDLPDSIFLRVMYAPGLWDTSASIVAYNGYNNPVTIVSYTGSGLIYNIEGFHYTEFDPTIADHKTPEATGVVVYPNPAKDRIYVSFAGGDAGLLSYEIVNNMGVVVVRGQVAGRQSGSPVDVGSLAPGLYFLHISNARSGTYRFIKE